MSCLRRAKKNAIQTNSRHVHRQPYLRSLSVQCFIRLYRQVMPSLWGSCQEHLIEEAHRTLTWDLMNTDAINC